MRESIYFMYDGQSSKDFGVYIASPNTGLFEENFFPNRRLLERKIAGREAPYLQRVENDPLSFTLSFVLEDWSEARDVNYLRNVAKWLFTDSFRPLIFDSNPNRIFYAIVEGQSSLFHNGAKEGYVELDIRCSSPYSYTPEYTVLNSEMRDGNDFIEIIEENSEFSDGAHSNTHVTSNGLTIESSVDTWGTLYANKQTWGGI